MSTEAEPTAPEPEVIAPVEPVAEPVVAETTGEGEDLQDDKPRGKSAEARINELTRARREAERERDYYKGLAGPQAPNSSPVDAEEPKPESFEDYGDYVKALAKHTVATEQAARIAQAQTQMREADFSSKIATARTTIADYADVVDKSEIMVSDHLRAALLESDKPGELLYHLAKHPEIADRLNGLSGIKAATEVGRLEASLAAPATPRISNAPAPAGTLRTTGSAVPVDLANADMDTYVAERRKQGARF